MSAASPTPHRPMPLDPGERGYFLALPARGGSRFPSVLKRMRRLALSTVASPPPGLLRGDERARLAPVADAIEAALKRDPRTTLELLGGPDALPLLMTLRSRARPAAECIQRLLDTVPALLDNGHEPTAVHALARLPSAHLALHDTNVLWSEEAHPDKEGNAIDLGGHPVDEWLARIDEALALIEVALPTLFAELRLSLRRIVPVGYEPEMHLSASYVEAPGQIYITLHPNALTMAEAIIHETQHGKLNALSWLDAVLHNGRSEWTTSPVRDDLRPLMGVLLAVHAFVPVAALHASLAQLGHEASHQSRFAARREEVLLSNGEGIRTLHRLGAWSPIGERVFGALGALQDRLVLES